MSFPSRITLKEPCGVNLVHASGVLCSPTNILETYLPFPHKKVNAAKCDICMCAFVASKRERENLKATKIPSATKQTILTSDRNKLECFVERVLLLMISPFIAE